MNKKMTCYLIITALITMLTLQSCKNQDEKPNINILFLHHSTGEVIYNGRAPSIIKKIAGKISKPLADKLPPRAQLPALIKEYNKEQGRNYSITEQEFPKAAPYGWNNNPYDYYNIWVYNAGDTPFKEEPTLEMLTKDYQVIIFKHCYPVSNIKPDQDSADVNSYYRSIANYKLQYQALKDKIHSFPDTKFILFTGAAQVEANIPEDEAKRAREFFTWVINEWDTPGDNIHIWDLYNLETDGGLYLKEDYAASANDSHPNGYFASGAVRLLFNRIIDVIETNGNNTTLKGDKIVSTE